MYTINLHQFWQKNIKIYSEAATIAVKTLAKFYKTIFHIFANFTSIFAKTSKFSTKAATKRRKLLRKNIFSTIGSCLFSLCRNIDLLMGHFPNFIVAPDHHYRFGSLCSIFGPHSSGAMTYHQEVIFPSSLII